MTIQIDASQAVIMAFSALGAPVLTLVVQDWRRRRKDAEDKIAREARREAEARERSEQHNENKERMDEMTRLLAAAFGANGRPGFLVHRQEFEALRSAHASDHARVNGHAAAIEGHNERITGLRRDVDELRRAE